MKTSRLAGIPGFRLFVTVAICLPTAASAARDQTDGNPSRLAPASMEEPSLEPTLHAIESSVFDADFSPGEATANAPAELEEIYVPKSGYLDSLGVDLPLDLLANPLEELYEKTGLRIGVAHTMLFMQPFGGQSSDYGAAGDLDLLTSWTLLGRGTQDTGRFVLTGEYRYQIGRQPPSLIGRQIGSLIAPTNAFNDRGLVVRDAYWVQRLLDARFRFIVGRADPSDYVGSYWLQNVNNSFVNRHFSANPAIPFPGHGPLLGISFRPTDEFYLTGGVSNAYSNTLRTEFDSLFEEWDLFAFGEFGYTPTLANLGAGRYALGVWHIDARGRDELPEDYGMTLIVDQNLGDHLQLFARYAYSEGTLTNVRQLAQSGVGLSGLLGRSDDLTGAAVSVAIPRNDNSRNETVAEIFHRFQTSRYSQLSVGLQLIANPANAPKSGAVGIFYARLRTSF